MEPILTILIVIIAVKIIWNPSVDRVEDGIIIWFGKASRRNHIKIHL